MSASVLEFQRYEASNRDSEIAQIAGEWIDRNDVSVTRGGQGGEAEIQHSPDFLRAAQRDKDISEGARSQLPDQAIGRGEYGREAQINYDGTLKAAKCNTPRCIDRVRYYPSQREEGENVTAAAERDS